MSRIYLIRHARPSAGWGGDDDPGLDEIGRGQAKAAAGRLLALPEADRPRLVVSSPLRRCQETARPSAEAIGVELTIDPAVGEIPTPKALAPDERGPWLRKSFAGAWRDIEGDLDYDAWRHAVTAAVTTRPGAAIFSHFVAINAVITQLAGLDQVVGFRPDHVSMSVFEVAGGALRLVERGPEAATQVL